MCSFDVAFYFLKNLLSVEHFFEILKRVLYYVEAKIGIMGFRPNNSLDPTL